VVRMVQQFGLAESASVRIPISRGLEIQSSVGLTRLRLLANRSALCPSVIYDPGRPTEGVYGEESIA
jgi:hypothetical protein